jgi:hypothetical protein
MDMLLITRPPTLTMRSASCIPLALALLSIHCMRAVSAAEDGHHRAAAEQEHVSSCPAPSNPTVALQAAVEQLLLEVGNLRRDMQELKAAAARPAPGTIVDSSRSMFPGSACPMGSFTVPLPSDKDFYYHLCIAKFTDVAASASSSAAAAAAAVAAAAVCFIAAEAAL